MQDAVPEDFPRETFAVVSGAQPKLLVTRDEGGRYVDGAAIERHRRWLLCQDLCEQLVRYVEERTTAANPEPELIAKVTRALDAKKEDWELTAAELRWIKGRLVAKYNKQAP